MGLAGRLGVEAAWGKRFEFCLIELFPVANVPGAGDYGRHPIVAMGVRRDLRMRRHAKHNCVHTRLIRITFEYPQSQFLQPRNCRCPDSRVVETRTRRE